MTAAFVLSWITHHLKLVAYGVAVAAVVFLFAAYHQEKMTRFAAEHDRDQARAAAIVQKGQADLNQTAATVADSAASRAVNITVRAEDAAHVVQAAPGASEALPAGLRAATLDAIAGMRREAAVADGVEDPGGAKPAGTVPPPGG